jgi:4-hydroxy-tetrahydrodipicolinate synthase
MVELQKAHETGQNSRAFEIHKKYFPLFRDLFIDSNPIPVKYAMNQVGFCGSQVRKPLMEMGAENLEQLRASLKQCGIQLGTRA